MRPVFLGIGLSGSQKAAGKASRRRAGGRTVNHKEGVTCTTNYRNLKKVPVVIVGISGPEALTPSASP